MWFIRNPWIRNEVTSRKMESNKPMQNTSRSVHAFVNLKKAVQKELFVTPLFSSLDPQRNHKDSARDFANLLDPSENRSSKAGGTEACARR